MKKSRVFGERIYKNATDLNFGSLKY